MSLLSDFLYGAARGLPTVIDDVRAREREELRLRMIEEERERQRTQSEQMYERGRKDKRSDLEEQRTYERQKLEEERRRQMLGNQEFAARDAAGRTGATPDEVARVSRGENPFVQQQQVPMQIDDGDRMRTVTTTQQAPDQERFAKVMESFNRALAAVSLGSKAKEVTGVLDAADKRERYNAMNEQEKDQFAKDEARFAGKDPDATAALTAARVALLESQQGKNDRWQPPAPRSSTGTTEDERKSAALVKIYENRAVKARDAANKATGGTKAQRSALEAAADRAEALAEEVIRTGKEPARAPAAAKPPGVPAGAPSGSTLGREVPGKGWEVFDSKGKLIGYARD